MFTWICPKCGLEVPPSSTECPNCAEAGPEPKQPPSQAGSAQYELVQPEPIVAAPVRQKSTNPPGWLLAVVFTIVFLSMGALGFAAYKYFSHRSEPVADTAAQPVRTPRTSGPDSATPSANVLNKYIEVTGIRLVEDNPKALQVQFVIVNHSSAPLIDVTGTVAIRPTTAPPNGETVGTFAFRIPELRPMEAKDMKAPLESKLRVYELPDWQFIRADVTVTSPQVNQ